MPQVKLGLIGGGYLGSIHARLALTQPDVHLVAVADPDPAARERLSAMGIPAVDDVDELLDQVEAAIVACPTHLHYPVARRLLEHNIHLLIEKPVTSSVGELDELVALAEEHHLVLQVGHVERFNPAWTAARPMISRACWIRAVRTSGYPCRSTDIGVVADLMIHDLDLVLLMVGSPLVEIHAAGSVVVGPHEDTADAWLTFANGATAALTASRVSHQAQRCLQIVTPEGTLDLDLAAQRCWYQRPDRERLEKLSLEKLDPDQRQQLKNRFFDDFLPRISIPVAERNALYDEQRDFIECVRTGKPPRVSARDIRPVMVLVEQIVEQISRFTHRNRLRACPKVPSDTAPVVRLRRKAG
ncbi:MAG: UDP-N-acetylglucosamine 3-dehydrogenase [Pirellulaceae bacterium]|nr:MAG: UDP-N-acetylglucosamine 3-dehydrogenase [Pirellulaceae bacterium]GIW91163.1 MAG: UDP-N-acetylglucosamine 3-dehydrogenase [Pirellulaceae bacterium]GIW95947.1 MAG: UDP-N-acetylglucosamine 3-dehydrogenase [Pirellulaceae bacterium]